MPLPLPEDLILKVKGMGFEDELIESDRVLLRALCCVDKMIFLLPISKMGLTLEDNPLLLQEILELKDMK